MKVVSLCAQKGGVGKTTLALHLAVCARQNGKNAKIIDLDPQATATSWADNRPDPPEVISAQAARLGKVLDALGGLEEQTDVVFIDTPPAQGDTIVTIAARHSDLVLIPCRIQVADIQAIIPTKEAVEKLGKAKAVVWNDEAPNRRASVVRDAEKTLAGWNVSAAPVVIHSRIGIGEAQDVSKTVLETEPASRAADEIRSLYGWISKQINQQTTKPL